MKKITQHPMQPLAARVAEGGAVTNLHAIADRLAHALRSRPCLCRRDYDRNLVYQCSGCQALAEFDALTAIVQTPQTAKAAAEGKT